MQAARADPVGPRLFSRWQDSSRKGTPLAPFPSRQLPEPASLPTAQLSILNTKEASCILLRQGTCRDRLESSSQETSPKSKTRETPRFRSRGTGSHSPSAHCNCHTWSPGPFPYLEPVTSHTGWEGEVPDRGVF